MPTKRRTASKSANRQAIPRSAPMPSKYPISNARKQIPGVSDERPYFSA
jgi:hypothetical protein